MASQEDQTTDNEIKKLTNVQAPDSTRPVYFHQQVVLDEDLAEELRKIYPAAPESENQEFFRDPWKGIEERPLFPLDPQLVGRLDSVATDGQGRIYKRYHFNKIVTVNGNSVEVSADRICVFDSDGKLLTEPSFPDDKMNDFSVNRASQVFALNTEKGEVTVYPGNDSALFKFTVNLKPTSLLQTPPYTFYAVSNDKVTTTAENAKSPQWPMYLQGATAQIIGDGHTLEFPNNGVVGKNGDYALIPGILSTEDNYGVVHEKKLFSGNQLTLSLYVMPTLRKDFIYHPKDSNIQCNNNIISSDDFGLGLVVWEAMDQAVNAVVQKSFLCLTLPGGSGFSSFDLGFKSNQVYHLLVTKNETSYRFYVNGELRKSGVVNFVETIASSNIYIGGDMPAYETARKRFEQLESVSAPGTVMPYFPQYFYQGTVGRVQIIPTTLSESDVRLFISSESTSVIRIKSNNHAVFLMEQTFGKIVVCGHNGVIKKVLDVPGLKPGDKITGLAVDSVEGIYVIVNDSTRILKFSEDAWNTSWLNLPDLERYTIRDIVAHGSGMIYVPFQGDNKAGIWLCDPDGKIIMELLDASRSFNQSERLAVSDSGEIFTAAHHCYVPVINDRLLADLRASRWSQTCRSLLTELNYARTRYRNKETFYQKALQRLQDLQTSDYSAVEEQHQQLREAALEVQEAETQWEMFKDFLLANGIRTSGTEREIENRINCFSLRQKFFLQCMLRSVDKSQKRKDVRRYKTQDGQFVDQYGVSLELHVKRTTGGQDLETDTLILLPIDDNDMESGRVLMVRNPAFSGKRVSPVSCTFREAYKMDLSWLGITLGEYHHSINLLPGETRDVKVTTRRMSSWETTVSVTSKTNRKMTGEREKQTKRTDDLEDKIHSELERNGNSLDDVKNTYTSSSASKTKFSADFGIPDLGLGLTMSAEGETTRSGVYDKHYKKSLDTVNKNVKDLMNKASTEVSERNKVSFSEDSSTETSQSRTDRSSASEEQTETIKIHNPNMGRTVNYHFFQIRNLYGTLIHAENAQFSFDTGVEIIPGTGITIRYSYSLSSFTRLANDLDLFSAEDSIRIRNIISAFVLRRYIRIDNEALEGMPRVVRAGNRSKKGLSNSELKQLRNTVTAAITGWRDRQEITNQLASVKDMIFSAQSAQISTEDLYAVNSGKFFVDSQVGVGEAVEAYLIDRRDIETATRRTQVEEIRERAAKGKFYQKLPDSVTHLNYDGKEEL